MVGLPLCRTEELSPVLVCQDGALRLLRGSDLVYEVEVAGPPQCATLNGADGGGWSCSDVCCAVWV